MPWLWLYLSKEAVKILIYAGFLIRMRSSMMRDDPFIKMIGLRLCGYFCFLSGIIDGTLFLKDS